VAHGDDLGAGERLELVHEPACAAAGADDPDADAVVGTLRPG
jgi:hypothetical protein